MKLESFTGPGATTSRRVFWDKVTAAVMSARKTEGKNASVTEYEGQGTLVAFKRDRGGVSPCPCADDLALVEDITTINLSLRLIGPCDCGDNTIDHTWTRVPIDTVPNENQFRFICRESDDRMNLDAGLPGGVFHGSRLEFIVNDVPNSGDRFDVFFDLGSDFGSPPCHVFSARPCLQTILHSCNSTGIRGCCTCGDPDLCLDTTQIALVDLLGVHTFNDTECCTGAIEPCTPETPTNTGDCYSIVWTLTVT